MGAIHCPNSLFNIHALHNSNVSFRYRRMGLSRCTPVPGAQVAVSIAVHGRNPDGPLERLAEFDPLGGERLAVATPGAAGEGVKVERGGKMRPPPHSLHDTALLTPNDALISADHWQGAWALSERCSERQSRTRGHRT